MNDSASIADMMETADYAAQRQAKEEAADLEFSVRREMDKGMTSDEMESARKVHAAAQAARDLLDKLF